MSVKVLTTIELMCGICVCVCGGWCWGGACERWGGWKWGCHSNHCIVLPCDSCCWYEPVSAISVIIQHLRHLRAQSQDPNTHSQNTKTLSSSSFYSILTKKSTFSVYISEASERLRLHTGHMSRCSIRIWPSKQLQNFTRTTRRKTNQLCVAQTFVGQSVRKLPRSMNEHRLNLSIDSSLAKKQRRMN